MKNYIIILAVFISGSATAQQFVEKAAIEYEVKTNLIKQLGTGSWADRMRDMLPKFKTGYYKYTFEGDKSIYKFDHWDPTMVIPEWYRKSDEENEYYFDHANGKFAMTKSVWGTNLNVEDSIYDIQWKLSSENRIIAGYNCRLASAILMDSVYIFAYYTDEIMISGGPVSITGLPGMVLGLTIPRLYSSWIATKVEITNVDLKAIKPLNSKKPMSRKELANLLNERIKKQVEGITDPAERNWADLTYWNTML